MRTDQKGERIMGATGHLGTAWRKRDYHRQWLWREANRLFDFFQNRAFNPLGGFHELDAEGRPLNPGNPVRGIHSTARMVHCFSIGSLLGRPGSDDIVDHGMKYLWKNIATRSVAATIGRSTIPAFSIPANRAMATPSCCSLRRAPSLPATPMPIA
jgi:hypothetical protein